MEARISGEPVMLTIHDRNVNGNYAAAINIIRVEGVRSDSRAGEVSVMPYPVMTVTDRPCERVLLCPRRDANPFFHFFESLWMLAGRQDADWLDRFVRDFSSRFAEDGGLQHGAYGHRWRKHWGVDQINWAIGALRDNHEDRRVVISMWDPRADIEDRPDGVRDLPCNTHIYPRVHNGHLDLTICCRSNDVVWGAYGANAVHFSFLLEYMAGRIGVLPGRMYQLSNNWHGYSSVLEKVGDPAETDPYETEVRAEPIGDQWAWWDTDLAMFMWEPGDSHNYVNEWFALTVTPMWVSHNLWAEGKRDNAMEIAQHISSTDWRLAVTSWMARRMS